MNKLYYGDNLQILREHLADESVDLIYLDPPFNSAQNYNVLFKEQDGSRSAAQIKVFEDTWRWDQAAVHAYLEIVERGGKLSQAMQSIRAFLGDNDMLAYLSMMAPRLIELHRVLRRTGSLYLHCDQTASHYLKMILDAVFGPENFLNEIVWRRYSRPKGSQHQSRRFGVSTDSILFYGKTGLHKFYADKVNTPLGTGEIQRRYSLSDEQGPYYSGPLLRSPAMGARPNLVYEYRGFTPGPEGWRMTRDKLAELDARGDMFWTENGIPRRKVRPDGTPVSHTDNLWTDIEAIGSQAAERLGYPTQKPEALLERILLASSREGDTVLDPFCGCGTTIAAAQRLKRRWTGIDITHLAISLIRNRLKDSFGSKAHYETIGEPVSLTDATTLAQADRYQFQWWALSLVNARPVEQKKGADHGIDGRIYFHDEGGKGKTKHIVISVKSGGVSVKDVRDLRGVVVREKAAIGVLITLENPTKPMRSEAASAGIYKSPWGTKHQIIQILTVDELLKGSRIDYPAPSNVTLKVSPRKAAHDGSEQTEL